MGHGMVDEAVAATADFVASIYAPAGRVAACDPTFVNYAIYEHCLPFNVAHAYDEASGITHPRIWTAEHDKAMWEALQG
jgi:hypothetical protein